MAIPTYYTTAEAAKLLGVHPNTVLSRIYAGEIRWINIGTPERPRVRIAEEDLRKWLESQASVGSAHPNVLSTDGPRSKRAAKSRPVAESTPQDRAS